jgi:hypothetical protein
MGTGGVTLISTTTGMSWSRKQRRSSTEALEHDRLRDRRLLAQNFAFERGQTHFRALRGQR